MAWPQHACRKVYHDARFNTCQAAELQLLDCSPLSNNACRAAAVWEGHRRCGAELPRGGDGRSYGPDRGSAPELPLLMAASI